MWSFFQDDAMKYDFIDWIYIVFLISGILLINSVTLYFLITDIFEILTFFN